MGVGWSANLAAAVSFSVLMAGAGGCAGSGLKKIGDGDRMLPQELREKFEVKETKPTDEAKVAENAEPPKAQEPVPAPPKKADPEPPKASAKKVSAPAKTEKKEKFTYPNRRPSGMDPIWPNEKHVFDITYFGMGAADVTLTVLPYKFINERKVYHVKGVAKSSSVFSLFYRLNDSLETFFDYSGLFSYRFHLVLDESRQTRNALELYDHQKGETFYWDRWNHYKKGFKEKKKYAPMKRLSQDSLSALYYMRTLPLKPKDVYQFPVASEGKNWTAVITVVRREMMDTPMGKVKTVVLKPEHKFKGKLKKTGDSFIWLTDDDRRFVVRIEAKVKIGTVVAALKELDPGTKPKPEAGPKK